MNRQALKKIAAATITFALIAPATALAHPSKSQARQCARSVMVSKLPYGKITRVGKHHTFKSGAFAGLDYRVVTASATGQKLKVWCGPLGPLTWVKVA
jgi:hypothetical protein